MSIPVSERLTTLSSSASVLSILDDHQPIYGYQRLINSTNNLEVSFNNGFPNGLSAGFGNYNFGKGTLPTNYGVWDPYKRFVSDGFIFAHNPAYTNDTAPEHIKFQRLFYKSGVDASVIAANLQSAGKPIHVADDLFEGGHFYTLKQLGIPFSLELGGVSYADTDFEFSSGTNPSTGELGLFILPDLNGDGEVSTADLNAFLTTFGNIGSLHNNQEVFGYPSAVSNPYSRPSSFYEVLTQFNSYPAITLNFGGINEVKSFPGQFSLLLYDAKRDSSFQITVLHLAEVVAEIAQIVTSGMEGGGTINITAPLLTTSQLENFFSIQNSPDLNADGSVSTADLLEFLTAFGQEADPAIPTLDVNTAVSYHGGALDSTVAVDLISLDPPYYPASSQPDITYSNQTFKSSYGEIDFFGAALSGLTQNPEVNGVLNQLSTIHGSEAYHVFELAWRLHSYVSNEESLMGAHTSPATGIFPLTELEMPPINELCFRSSAFDDMLEASGISASSYVFENMFASGDIFIQSAPLFTYGGFSLVDFTDSSTEDPPSPAYWAALDGVPRRNYGLISDRGTTTSSLLAANARFEVTVNGYVCCNDGSAPIVPIFLRVAGQSSLQAQIDGDVSSFSDVVYVLGHVDMSEGTTYDESNDEKYKTFEFTRDFASYQCPFDTAFASEVANKMPSILNANSDVAFGVFSTQIADFAKSVFITGVEFNYKNSKNATLE